MLAQVQDVIIEWRPIEILLGLGMLGLIGKEIWPFVFRTKVERVTRSAFADETRSQRDVTDAILARDEQGRLRIHGWDQIARLERVAAALTASLSAVSERLDTSTMVQRELAQKVHKGNNGIQATLTVSETTAKTVDRLEGRVGRIDVGMERVAAVVESIGDDVKNVLDSKRNLPQHAG